MSVEGIWKVEMMGPYGWEKVSTALLKDGRFFGASVDHYSTGSYEFADNILTADLHLNQHGKVRAVYGTKKREMDTRLEGKLKKEGKIVGKSLAAGKKQFEVNKKPY